MLTRSKALNELRTMLGIQSPGGDKEIDSKLQEDSGAANGAKGQALVPPIIWQTGNVAQIRSLLVLREAELVAAKAQITGNDRADWYAKNRIGALEKMVADLRKWLAEAADEDDES